MGWLKRLFGPSAYDQGHQDGFKEGYKECQDWGHEHGACEHTHPFEEAKAALGMRFAASGHAPQTDMLRGYYIG